ncbi:hypothetical protein R3P38DRAFT_2808819 [Favolaschia claudopus]|uniref:Uncharacterized protein n=1 Tax=Favolaschia claudopus TaxID=2862362 RepID=A0AAV9ZFJ4_9AGAR
MTPARTARSRTRSKFVIGGIDGQTHLSPGNKKRHEKDYPWTIALLGNANGTLAEKRAAIEREFVGELRKCVGDDCADPDCVRRRHESRPTTFEIKPALPRHVLEAGRLGDLLRAREELLPKKRKNSSDSPSSTQATVASSPSPPSPSPSHVPVAVAGSSTELQAAAAAPPPQLLPPLERLRFFNGGYGGAAVYSPDGYYTPPQGAVVGDDDGASVSDYELGYPEDAHQSSPDIILDSDDDAEYVGDHRSQDVNKPVYLFVWDHNTPATKPIIVPAFPRATEDESPFCRGEVLLRDVREALRDEKFSIEENIQRCFEGGWRNDEGFRWSTINFKRGALKVYGTNKVIYLRNVGVDVTPPITTWSSCFPACFPLLPSSFPFNLPTSPRSLSFFLSSYIKYFSPSFLTLSLFIVAPYRVPMLLGFEF